MDTPVKLGFELPNHDKPGPETWAQVDALRSTIVKVRGYHLTPETIREIVRRDLDVILRPNSDGYPEPFDRANELMDGLVKLAEAGVHHILIIPDNEPNLRTDQEPNGKAYIPGYWELIDNIVERILSWYAVSGGLKWVEIISPPLALAQNEPEWYDAGRHIIAKNWYAYQGIHPYGETDNSLVTYALDLAGTLNKPLLADELGNTDLHLGGDNKAFAVASYARQAAEAGVVAATIFIAQTPTEHWTYCTLPTDKLGMIADAVAAVISEAPATTPEPPAVLPDALPLADTVLAQWPRPAGPSLKPLVWDQWEPLVRRGAQLQPHLTPHELAQVALGPLATLDQESDGKVRADGDERKSDGYFCSRGLFQLNTCGGAGTQMMRKHGLTDPAALYDVRYQYEHAERLLLATETELYWARKENRPYWPGRAVQGVQRSSSDPSGAGYQAAYQRLAAELGLEVQPMGKAIKIGNLWVADVSERYPSTYSPRPLQAISHISIHHSVTPTLPETASYGDEIAALDAIHAYHLKEFKGIAYHLAVFPSGECYQLADWGTTRYLVGGDQNFHTLGVLLVGTFTDDAPGEAQLVAAARLIANIRYQLGNADLPVKGHRDISATVCPGNTWPQWKDRLTEALAIAPPPPVDTRSALHIQLDAIWGSADKLGDHPEAVAIRQAVIAAKDAAGIA